MEAPIGKIERIALREVWKHEAHHFTRWLADNLDVLREAVGIELTLVQREACAGDFNVDLLAKDAEGKFVVIENQLGASDHDHLGKLLTYLSAFEASAAIWIVGESRVEHTRAVAWLNESSSADVYLVRAEAVRISGSAPALLLTKIVGPSEEARVVAREKQAGAKQDDLRREFWNALLDRIRSRGVALHSTLNAPSNEWISASAGLSGLQYVYRLPKSGWNAEFYVDRGSRFAAWAKAVFDWLQARRASIDTAGGPGLQWMRQDPRQHAKIMLSGVGDWRSPQEEWDRIQDEMIDAMQRLHRAFGPLIEQIRLQNVGSDQLPRD